MYKFSKMMRLFFIGLVVTVTGCAGAYVGVGVHTPGPWGGPYPHGRGTVIIGRPMSGTYYPHKNTGQNTVSAYKDIEQPTVIVLE